MKDYRAAYNAFMKCYPFTLADIDGEEWRNIEDANDYQISNCGRVKSFKGKNPRIIKPTLTNGGYLKVDLRTGGRYKTFSVHRLVAKAFLPKVEDKPDVNHKDGHKLNNYVDNLEWVTHQENAQHAVKAGLNPLGEDNYQAQLTNEQVLYCREVYIPNDKSFGATALAKKFNVNKNIICDAVHGATYKSVGGAIHASLPHTYKPPRFLTESEKAEIQSLHVKGNREFGGCALARRYNVNRKTIAKILNEK